MYNKQYTLYLKLIEKRTVNYNSIINQLIIIITTTIIIYLLNNLYTPYYRALSFSESEELKSHKSTVFFRIASDQIIFQEKSKGVVFDIKFSL